MSDARAVDAQMDLEKTLSSLAFGLSGANMIYESSGMMASLLGVSFEAFITDNEMPSHVYRTIRGIEVSEATLGFETMKKVITCAGHFIGETQTMQAMERDYYYPQFGDHIEPTTWAQEGVKDIWQKTNEQTRKILECHKPEYFKRSVDASIRSAFDIKIS